MRKRMVLLATAAIMLFSLVFGRSIAAQTPVPALPSATIPAQKAPDTMNKFNSVPSCQTAANAFSTFKYDTPSLSQAVMDCSGQLISQMRADYASRTPMKSETIRAYLEFFSNAENALARDKILLPDTDIRVLNGWYQEAQYISPYLVYGIAPPTIFPSPTPRPAEVAPSPTPKSKRGHLYFN